MSRWFFGLALVGGCAMGPNEETRLTALTVVGLPAERGDWLPGEAQQVTAVVGDPSFGEGLVGALFLCTGFGTGCAEASLAVPFSTLVQPISGESPSATLQVPALPPGALPPGAAVGVWALMCRPGACDVLDALTDPPAPGTPAWDALWARLGDPAALLEGVALDDAALASRFVPLVVDAAAPRNLAPVLTLVDAPLVAAPGGELVLRVDVVHASLASGDTGAGADTASGPVADLVGFGLATHGAFGQRADDANDGSARLRWFAPEEAGPAELFMVVNDGLGGQAVVRHRLDVVAP